MVDYIAGVRINEEEIRRLAGAVVSALLKQGFVHPKVSEKDLAERVAGVFRDDLRAEAALEKEAEQLAERHSRQMVGMDHRKVVQGIKARLAKERGFSL